MYKESDARPVSASIPQLKTTDVRRTDKEKREFIMRLLWVNIDYNIPVVNGGIMWHRDLKN